MTMGFQYLKPMENILLVTVIIIGLSFVMGVILLKYNQNEKINYEPHNS